MRFTKEFKLECVNKYKNGESITEVALSNGIENDLLSKWFKIYKFKGIDGLKLDGRGRPPKMKKKIIYLTSPKPKKN